MLCQKCKKHIATLSTRKDKDSRIKHICQQCGQIREYQEQGIVSYNKE